MILGLRRANRLMRAATKMNEKPEYNRVAAQILERAGYCASEENARKLAANMMLLDARELNQLNQRLQRENDVEQTQDTFAEHVFATFLLSHHPPEVSILYEPNEGHGTRVDFRLILPSITYWIEMKRLAILKVFSIQSAIADKIDREAQRIGSRKIYRLQLAEAFGDKDLPEFRKFFAQHAATAEDEREYSFPTEGQWIAKVTFCLPPKNLHITHLTRGSLSGGYETDSEHEGPTAQIRGSLRNAAKAFEWNCSQNTLNLVAIDSGKYFDFDMCNALFGTIVLSDQGGKRYWRREKDGFFAMAGFRDRVAGVIAIKRNWMEPLTIRSRFIYVNEVFRDRLPDLNRLLPFDRHIHFKMRPPIGTGDFEIPDTGSH